MIREYRETDYVEVNELGKLISNNISIGNDLEKILVYEMDGHIIGFVLYMKLYEVLEIEDIVVKDEYRRKGIGRKLIETLLSDKRIEKVILEVRKNNESAIGFYSSLGFNAIREIKNYYGNGIDAQVMEMKIHG